MYVVPEPANILAALMCALEQPHTITERDGELFIVSPAGSDKMQLSTGHAASPRGNSTGANTAILPGMDPDRLPRTREQPRRSSPGF
jgi:hypothetical protein